MEQLPNCRLTMTITSLYPTLFRWNLFSYKIQHQRDNFISHIVQMEPSLLVALALSPGTLYPTLFRWNHCNLSVTKQYLHSLYPTLFRWNIILTFNPIDANHLYIPHCSDGTEINNAIGNQQSDFISHIVQMEPPLPEIIILIYRYLSLSPHKSDKYYPSEPTEIQIFCIHP